MRVQPGLMWINADHPCVRMMVCTSDEERTMEDDCILREFGPTRMARKTDRVD